MRRLVGPNGYNKRGAAIANRVEKYLTTLVRSELQKGTERVDLEHVLSHTVQWVCCWQMCHERARRAEKRRIKK